MAEEDDSLGCIIVLLCAHLAELIPDIILQRWVVPFPL
jgi:hypothetical protein